MAEEALRCMGSDLTTATCLVVAVPTPCLLVHLDDVCNLQTVGTYVRALRTLAVLRLHTVPGLGALVSFRRVCGPVGGDQDTPGRSATTRQEREATPLHPTAGRLACDLCINRIAKITNLPKTSTSFSRPNQPSNLVECLGCSHMVWIYQL
jgi:hypothetical protein